MWTKVQRDKDNSFHGRVLPARIVIRSDWFLSKMNCPDDVALSEWETLSKWLAIVIKNSLTLFNPTYLIALPSNSTTLTVHGNKILIQKQTVIQYHYFKNFLLYNSIPTEISKAEKTPYLVSTIWEISALAWSQTSFNIGNKENADVLKHESLTLKFNTSFLSAFQNRFTMLSAMRRLGSEWEISFLNGEFLPNKVYTGILAPM